MKKIMLIIVLSLPVLLHAQSVVKGKIRDASGNLLDAATVTLKQGDKQIASAFADRGSFTITYHGSGTFTVMASLVGYQPLTQTVQLPKDSISLVMQSENKQLREVIIAYRKPLIERKLDRVTFNVENSVIATGGSAWEALTKAPGVQVNASNELSANHKTVQVYLDGKPLRISGDDLAGYLKGLPSDLVASIELYANPPARFEAEGATVINIITKKPKKPGTNATVNTGLTQGRYSTYVANAALNYRNNRLNIFGSYGFTHRHNYQDHNTDIDYGNSLWNSINRNVFESDNHNYRLGIDYQLSKHQLLGLLLTGSNRNGNTVGQTMTRITNPNMVLDSTLQTNNFSDNAGNQYAYNLNYNLKLDSGKRTLNVDVDYSPFTSKSNAIADNLSFFPNGLATGNNFHIYTPSSQHINIYSGKADFTSKIGHDWDLTAGLKYSSTESRNDFDYYDRSGSTLSFVPANANHFIYKEKTAAAYASAAAALGKWTLQGGLRGEYTRTSGYSLTLDTLNRRNYFKIFPTVFVQYRFNDDHELQLNYAYRIERPEYFRLNPAKRYSSPYNIYVGNPSLQPAFVHNIELNYTYKKNYTVIAYYTATNDVFTNINLQDNATKIYYGTQANLGLSSNLGMRLSAGFQLTQWWDLNIFTEAYRQREKSAYLTSSFDYHLFSYDATLKQAFTIDKKTAFKAEISAVLNGPGIQGIYYARQNSEIDAGMKINVLKNMGVLKLGVNDLFNTNNNKVSINYLDQRSSFFHQVESRTVTVSFSYRLGGSVAASRIRSTSSDDERHRAQ